MIWRIQIYNKYFVLCFGFALLLGFFSLSFLFCLFLFCWFMRKMACCRAHFYNLRVRARLEPAISPLTYQKLYSWTSEMTNWKPHIFLMPYKSTCMRVRNFLFDLLKKCTEKNGATSLQQLLWFSTWYPAERLLSINEWFEKASLFIRRLFVLSYISCESKLNFQPLIHLGSKKLSGRKYKCFTSYQPCRHWKRKARGSLFEIKAGGHFETVMGTSN